MVCDPRGNIRYHSAGERPLVPQQVKTGKLQFLYRESVLATRNLTRTLIRYVVFSPSRYAEPTTLFVATCPCDLLDFRIHIRCR